VTCVTHPGSHSTPKIRPLASRGVYLAPPFAQVATESLYGQNGDI
jgi:hypothetical protein